MPNMKRKAKAEPARLDADRKAKPKTKLIATLAMPADGLHTIQSNSTQQFGQVKTIGLALVEEESEFFLFI